MNDGISEELMHLLNEKYHKLIIKTGFLKSTFGTLAMTGGGGLIFLYFSNRDFYDVYLPVLGALFIAIGFIIYYAGDIYKINQNKEIEELRLKRAASLIDQKISEEQERLAEEVVAQADAKKRAIDIDTARQMQEIRDGICSDISKLSSSEDELTYCKTHTGNTQLEYVRYPDNYPVNDILEIGMQKLKDRGEEVTTGNLDKYCTDLYELGLISNKAFLECQEKLRNVKPTLE